ncbi:MAG TPA: hypothetical protein VFS00_32105, partial [Polyangiaceae bacterium]|nr:hypothetical protein [Polyangiaceae bacterium]
MHHPLLDVSRAKRGRVSAALSALALGLMAWLRSIDGRLRGPGSEGGIVGLEFCGRVDACAAQLGAIAGRGEAASLGFSLGLDYAFLAAYSTAIAAAIVFLVDREASAPRLARVRGAAIALAWLQWAAAGFDAVENVALWQMASGGAA